MESDIYKYEVMGFANFPFAIVCAIDSYMSNDIYHDNDNVQTSFVKQWWFCTYFSVSPGDPNNKIHGTNMGSTWVLSAPDGPHVGPMNLAIRGVTIWGVKYVVSRDLGAKPMWNFLYGSLSPIDPTSACELNGIVGETTHKWAKISCC